MYRQKEARLFRIGLELLPQSHQVRVYRSRGGISLVSPHILQQAFASKNFARVGDEILQQLELHGGKLNRLAVAADTTGAKIHLDVTEGIPVLFFRQRLTSTQHSFDPGDQLAGSKTAW
jgi:hypothetical protein